jgi:transcriptional regulator with XRE-family HTH domain
MPKKEIPAFSRLVKELRDAAGITQQELATRAGLSISLVTQIEQGSKADPKLSTLHALAQALGVDVAALAASGPPEHSADKPARPPKNPRGRGKRNE